MAVKEKVIRVVIATFRVAYILRTLVIISCRNVELDNQGSFREPAYDVSGTPLAICQEFVRKKVV